LRPLVDRTDRFVRRVSLYRNCCRRIESEFASHRLRVTDVELVYSSSFLSVASHWETLLGEVIFDTVLGAKSNKPGNQRFAQFQNRQRLLDVLLFPNKDYVSIPNLRQAETLAALFVQGGRPISVVSEPNRTFIQQAVFIRNAIAHESDFAMDKFQTKVPGVTSLPGSKRSPGAFLRHEFRVSPSQRRYEIYFAAFQSAAAEIAAAW
jgi:hypothetical protein